jgi:hypothetical protein
LVVRAVGRDPIPKDGCVSAGSDAPPQPRPGAAAVAQRPRTNRGRPNPFERGSVRRRTLGWLIGLLPPRPADQAALVLDHKAATGRHYLRGVVWLVAVYVLCLVVAGAGWWLLVSPLSIAAVVVHVAVPQIPLGVAFLALNALLLARMAWWVRRQGGGFRQGLATAALREEQMFREGAENWTGWERVKSCVIFALVHLWNLYVPIALLPALAACGAAFMRTYLCALRRGSSRPAATLEAAAQHYAYNCVVVVSFLVPVVAVVLLVTLRAAVA